MKILIWSQYFWPENFHINEVAAALTEVGHQVIVLTGKPNYPSGVLFDGYSSSGTSKDRFGDISIYRVPIMARGTGGVRLALNYLSFVLSGYFFAKRLLKGETFDLIFVYAPSPIFQTLPAILVAKRARVPLVLWVQDLWPDVLEATGSVRNKMVIKTVDRVVRYIYHKSDFLLAQSEVFRESIERYLSDPKKVAFFPNSEKSPNLHGRCSFAASELAESMKNYFAVTFTGNLGNAQSLETIVKAARALSVIEDVRFFLVGSGSRLNWLVDQISDQGLSNVVLAGQFPKEDMHVITNASSLLLLTLRKSVIGSATIPNKLQSYLAMGRPIVASADGEAARIVKESASGKVCDAGDDAGLAAAILDLRALSSEERAVLGANGRAYFEENFNLTRAVARLSDIFEDVRSRSAKLSR